MEAPAITRRRRPFLAPIWLPLLVIAAGFAVIIYAYSQATTTTYIVLRHAEKQLGTIEDPPLAAQGEERAQRLARLLGAPGALAIDAIYVTPTRRAQATAAPAADRLGVPVVVTDSGPRALLRQIQREHHGGAVVIIGHSNTVPELVERLSHRDDLPPFDENDYSRIYVVSVPDLGKGSVVTLQY